MIIILIIFFCFRLIIWGVFNWDLRFFCLELLCSFVAFLTVCYLFIRGFYNVMLIVFVSLYRYGDTDVSGDDLLKWRIWELSGSLLRLGICGRFLNILVEESRSNV